MVAELEDKYERFERYFNIDIKTIEEAATGGDLSNYYTKAQSDTITNALDARIDILEAASGADLSNYYTKSQTDTLLNAKAALTVTDALDTRLDALELFDIGNNYYTKTQVNSSLAGKQGLDQDLTDIAGLSPTNNDVLQRKSGAWINRTPSQLKTDLSLVKGDVGLGNVDNTSDVNKPISTATQTALDALDTRVDVLEAPTVFALTDASTVTPNLNTAKNFSWSLGSDRTLAPPSNPVNGANVVIAALASGAQRVLTIDSGIKLTTGITSPITIASGKTQYLGLRYNGTSWFLIASTQES